MVDVIPALVALGIAVPILLDIHQAINEWKSLHLWSVVVLSFGGVWTLLRMRGTIDRLSLIALREELALTEISVEAFLRPQLVGTVTFHLLPIILTQACVHVAGVILYLQRPPGYVEGPTAYAGFVAEFPALLITFAALIRTDVFRFMLVKTKPHYSPLHGVIAHAKAFAGLLAFSIAAWILSELVEGAEVLSVGTPLDARVSIGFSILPILLSIIPRSVESARWSELCDQYLKLE